VPATTTRQRAQRVIRKSSRASRHAAVGQVAKLVHVEAVLARRQARHLARHLDGAVCSLEQHLAVDLFAL
jgi:hypothetical protein